MELRNAQPGDIVLFTPNPDDKIAQSNYNNGEIPAIITRVWSAQCVNIKIIPDCGPMQDRTSVVHFSINPAGYHFRFKDEVKYIMQTGLQPDSGLNVDDSADASTFLHQKEPLI